MLRLLWIFGFLLLDTEAYAGSADSPLKTLYEWKYFDYDWKSAEQRQAFIDAGKYDPKKMAPIDVDQSNDGRTFVTIIRDEGVPASVHTVTDKSSSSGPLLKPYPDWSWYSDEAGCSGITSVFRVAIDECNRMWVLDTGKIGEKKVCPAQLVVFDLRNDRLIFRQKIPAHVAENKDGEGQLITPIVETYGLMCRETTVYIADVSGHGLVIWNGYKLYRLEADVYAPEERNTNFTIAGQSFHLPDGVLGMALSPMGANGRRLLAFRPLASRSMYAADTSVLKRSVFGEAVKYYRGIDVLPSQASAMVFSKEGILFYGLTSEIAIGCWNVRNPLRAEYFKIAIQDKERLQFASGMKVIKGTQLLIMTNRLQKIWTDTTNLSEINFRVLSAPVKSLIERSDCAN